MFLLSYEKVFLILFECLMRPFLINVFKNIFIVLGYTNEIFNLDLFILFCSLNILKQVAT